MPPSIASSSRTLVPRNPTSYFFVAYHTPSGGHNIKVYDSEYEFNANNEKVRCVLVICELRAQHPRDRRVVETNNLLAYLYASNTNVQFFGREDMVVAVAKYVVAYCSKNPVRIANILSTSRQVTRDVDKMDATKCAQPGDKESMLLTRIMNPTDKNVGFSAQLAAISLVGYPSLHCSHQFAVVHP